jgi:hypothetical protein
MTTLEQARITLDVNKLKLPKRPHVEAITVENYVTYEGEEALRVQIVIGEDTTDQELMSKSSVAIKNAIRDALRDAGIKKFPYVYVAKPSELQ